MACCCSCVGQGTVEIIERFGKFHRVAHPGFNWICCCVGSRSVGAINMRVRQLDVSCETKTRDNVFVKVVTSVQYQVVKENVYDAFYKLTNTKTQMRSYVFDVVRATVPKMDLDDVFASKESIALDVKAGLTKAMGSFGFVIISSLVTDIEPDRKVKDAMNKINAAKRMREAALQTAEAEKVKVVKAAEADAEAKFLAGQGIARQRQAIVRGLRESVMAFSADVHGITSKEIMEMMMMTQYFDTMKDVGASNHSSAVFVPHQSGAAGDVASQTRGGSLQGQSGR